MKNLHAAAVVVVLSVLLAGSSAIAQRATRPATRKPPPAPQTAGDRMIDAYFAAEVDRIAGHAAGRVAPADDRTTARAGYRRQLAEMLGLDPMPERTDLKPVVTGTADHAEFTVELLHFQSRPGLYVTGNLYVPKGVTKPVPAVLYVCGHSNNKKDGVSYGAKVSYQHHGGWYARNGYVCLIVDTLQLGEIEGIHHGLYRERMWWWLSRGYTPAGVEAWNGLRAIDYLQSRKEVDPKRIGVTGRSGGGASSWWIAALDDRVGAAVPTAGITDLHNHVADGVVEGHCDCMYLVNTYRWDYAEVAALVAPRALLIANTDKDPIFPLDGVVRLHRDARRAYEASGPDGDAKRVGLLVTEGGHVDTQDLQVPTFRWFNRFLKDDAKSQVDKTAVKFFEPEQLRVFKQGLPADQRNTAAHDWFVPQAPPPAVPASKDEWAARRDAWLAALKERTFRGWPDDAGPLGVKEAFSVAHDGVRLRAFDFTSQPRVTLRLYVAHRDGLERPELAVLNVLDPQGWTEWLAGMRPAFGDALKGESPDAPPPGPDAKAWGETARMFKNTKWAMAYLAPRGVGPTAFGDAEKRQTQVRRRFWLLGQTLEGMQVWDARRAAQALRSLDGMAGLPLWMQAERQTAGVALYASLFEPDVARLDLWRLPASHRDGPQLLNVLKTLDLPAAVALAAERSKVRIYQADKAGWEYPADVARKLGWGDDRVQVRAVEGTGD